MNCRSLSKRAVGLDHVQPLRAIDLLTGFMEPADRELIVGHTSPKDKFRRVVEYSPFSSRIKEYSPFSSRIVVRVVEHLSAPTTSQTKVQECTMKFSTGRLSFSYRSNCAKCWTLSLRNSD